MERKLYNKDCITLDGRMDEQVWESVEAYTGFKGLGKKDVLADELQTFFKIIPCEDRIYIGVKCMEPNIEQLKASVGGSFAADSVELFLAPSGNPYDFYQFLISPKGAKISIYYEEAGVIKPDPFAPEWNYAYFIGEDYWSAEVELPFTAFYMTSQDRWTDTWLVNIGRTQNNLAGARIHTTWSYLEGGFRKPNMFNSLGGFPVRNPRDEVSITSAIAEINKENTDGYFGNMKLAAKTAFAGKYIFSSDHGETVELELNEGVNEFSVPCFFQELTRYKVALSLTRVEDGKEFKRYYPVMVTYEPIAIQFTLPEYRGNFYPGQDTSKIAGKVISALPVTLKLEGPGIETTELTPDAEGNFLFETPNFEIGDAILSATTAEQSVTRKIRNLPTTERMMTWISGGNLIVNGKPTLRRNMYAEYYMGGEAFKRRYDADDLHQTLDLVRQEGWLEPARVIKGAEAPGGEAIKDAPPSAEMLACVDKVIEDNKDKDFAYYYLVDEPECRGVSGIYLRHLYNYIAEKDPYHVILTASRNCRELINIADWFETHPYINAYTDAEGKRVYARQIASMGKFIDSISALNRPDKCIGFLPTCFAAMRSRKDPNPTLDEYICHTWAAMIHGGKTLWPYAYHDMNDRASMYEGTRYIFSSFEALEEIVLLGKRTFLLQNAEVEAVLYELDGEKMFVAVNMTNEPQQITLDGISGDWNEFRHNRTISGNTFELKPLEVLVGTSRVKDSNLPTYQEVAALVEAEEYKRTHGGSLLFGRRNDIAITSSGSTGWVGKLFDGVPDNLGWTQVGDTDKFIELNLTMVKPAFTKVVLNGWHIDDAKLILKNGEEAIAVDAEVQTEEFATTFYLKEAVTPDALRLEFTQKRIELYEIAVF